MSSLRTSRPASPGPSPTVELDLIVAMGAFQQPLGVLCRAALPFIALMLGCLALVTWQPWIAIGPVK